VADLPETTERPERLWRVTERLFVFERPLRRADREDLADHTPSDPPLGVWVPDLGVKEALLASASCARQPLARRAPVTVRASAWSVS